MPTTVNHKYKMLQFSSPFVVMWLLVIRNSNFSSLEFILDSEMRENWKQDTCNWGHGHQATITESKYL